jgi:hypothetical protein
VLEYKNSCILVSTGTKSNCIVRIMRNLHLLIDEEVSSEIQFPFYLVSDHCKKDMYEKLDTRIRPAHCFSSIFLCHGFPPICSKVSDPV